MKVRLEDQEQRGWIGNSVLVLCVGGKLQILGLTGVAVRSVLAMSGDSPGGHPIPTYPDGFKPEEDRWPVRRALQAGTANQAPLGLLYPRIPEDSHSHARSPAAQSKRGPQGPEDSGVD